MAQKYVLVKIDENTVDECGKEIRVFPEHLLSIGTVKYIVDKLIIGD